MTAEEACIQARATALAQRLADHVDRDMAEDPSAAITALAWTLAGAVAYVCRPAPEEAPALLDAAIRVARDHMTLLLRGDATPTSLADAEPAGRA